MANCEAPIRNTARGLGRRSKRASTTRSIPSKPQTIVRPRSTSRRRDEQVRRLLAGEILDDSLLEYDFDRWHICVMARGPGGAEGLEGALAGFDARRLTVCDGAGDVWTWLGTQERLRSDRLQEAIPNVPPEGLLVGIGGTAWGRQGGVSPTNRPARRCPSPAPGSDPLCATRTSRFSRRRRATSFSPGHCASSTSVPSVTVGTKARC